MLLDRINFNSAHRDDNIDNSFDHLATGSGLDLNNTWIICNNLKTNKNNPLESISAKLDSSTTKINNDYAAANANRQEDGIFNKLCTFLNDEKLLFFLYFF